MACLPVFAGSFLSGEYIPSRNVLDLEKQSGIFLIWDLGVDWIFKQQTTKGQTRSQLSRQNAGSVTGSGAGTGHQWETG